MKDIGYDILYDFIKYSSKGKLTQLFSVKLELIKNNFIILCHCKYSNVQPPTLNLIAEFSYCREERKIHKKQ